MKTKIEMNQTLNAMEDLVFVLRSLKGLIEIEKTENQDAIIKSKQELKELVKTFQTTIKGTFLTDETYRDNMEGTINSPSIH